MLSSIITLFCKLIDILKSDNNNNINKECGTGEECWPTLLGLIKDTECPQSLSFPVL